MMQNKLLIFLILIFLTLIFLLIIAPYISHKNWGCSFFENEEDYFKSKEKLENNLANEELIGKLITYQEVCLGDEKEANETRKFRSLYLNKYDDM
jgi:hypothetical protein